MQVQIDLEESNLKFNPAGDIIKKIIYLLKDNKGVLENIVITPTISSTDGGEDVLVGYRVEYSKKNYFYEVLNR